MTTISARKIRIFFLSAGLIAGLLLAFPVSATHDSTLKASTTPTKRIVNQTNNNASKPQTTLSLPPVGKWMASGSQWVASSGKTIVDSIAGLFKSISQQLAGLAKVFASKPPEKKLTGIIKPTPNVTPPPVLAQANNALPNPSPKTTGMVLGVTEDLTALGERVAVLETNLIGLSTPSSLSTLNTTSDNLLRNSSFEVESSSKPRQWNYQLSSTTGNTFRSEEAVRSGKFSLKFKGGGDGLFGISQPDVKTTSGRTYTFSAYVKVINAPSITFKMGFWDEKNNKRGTMKDFTFKDTKEWSRISMTATTTGLITDSKNWFPLIEITGLTSGNVYLDDAQLEEGSVLTAYNTAIAKSGSTGGLGDGSIIAGTNGDLHPAQSGVGSLGSSSEKWEDLYLSDDANIGDSLTVDGDVAVNGDDLTSDGNLTINATGYVRIGDSGTPGVADGDDELYVLGDIESDGNLNIAGNVTITGTLTSGSGSSTTSDSIDITPSTNIDALDITGTNITTASLIDLDPTGTTTGNIIDIDTSTAHSGHVLSVDNTGNAIWTGNIIDVATGTGDASGDVLKMTFEAGATDVQGIVLANSAASDQAGWFINIAASGIYTSDVISFDNTGNTASSGDFISFASGTGDADGDVFDITVEAGATSTQIIDINNAAASDEAGWLLEVDTTGAWTGNMIDIALGAQLSTGDIMNVSMGSTNVGGGVLVVADAGGARTDALIDITSASTGDGNDASALLQLNSTGVLLSGSNLLDINRSGGAASNVIDITTSTTASAGNLIDLNVGAITDTGDAINIDLGATATGAQALVVTSGVMTRTTDLFSITDSGTSSGDTMEIALTGATTGHGVFINNDAMVATGNVLYIDSDADRSSTSLFVIDDIADDTASAPTIDINATGATDQPILNIDASAANGALIDLNHTLADVTVQTYFIRGTYTDTADAEADFLLFEDAGGTAQFLIAEDGNTTITGTGDGTAALTLTTGDLTVSDGDLTVSGGDVNFTTDAGDTLNIAKGAAPTADVVLIAAGSPATTNVDALAITMTTTDQTDITNSLMNLVLTSGGTAATDIARGIFIDLASTAGGTDTAIEIENTAAWDVDIALQFDETISNVNDDSIVLTGVGGTNNASVTFDLDGASATNVPALVSGGSDLLTVFDSLSVGINGETTENIASSDFAFSGGNDLYVDDKVGINGVLSVDGNLWQGDAVTTTTKTTAFLFLGTTAGAPTGDPATPAGFAGIVYDTTNNKLCAEEEAAGAAWLCTGALVDVAEWMPAAGAESGDLVSITNLENPVDDPTAPFMLGKTTKAYDNKLVGVISKYAEDAESALGYKRSADYHAVTLVGRVPVKVSGGNGVISRGDYLTSAATAGYAMKATKAGPVVGMALESFNGDKGTIMVFVKASYYDPVVEEQQEVLAALAGSGDVLGTTTVSGTQLINTTTSGALSDGKLAANTLSVTELAEFKGNLTVAGAVEFKGTLSVAQDLTVGGNLEVGGAVVINATAGEALKAGEAVYIASSGVVKKASNSDETKAQVLGLVTQDTTENEQVQIAVAGKVSGLSGLEVGKRYFLGTDGKLVIGVNADAKKLVQVGLALTDSQLVLQIFADTKLEVAAPSPTAQITFQATPTPQPSITTSVSPSLSPSPSASTSATSTASPNPTNNPTKTITVNETELGFLRVRSDAAASSSEVGQVKPGQTFIVLSEQDGWYKIEYESGKTGWVSASYVTVNQ